MARKRQSSKRRSSRQQTGTRTPHPDDAKALNRAFYAAEPGDYFSRRLNHLLVLASQTDEELRPEARTYRCGRLTTTIGKAEGDELNEKRHKAFVLVEAEMVVHHLAETLTRLFIVHAARPPIPWISMMQLRGQGEFKRQLEHVLSDSNQETFRSDVGWVFLGSAEQPEEEPDDAMPWNEAVDRIAPYLDHFGRVFLNRAEVYNAAKHGLTMQPGDTAIELVGVPELAVSGPSLAHLAYGEEDGERVWVVKNRWLDVEQELALASVGYHLIDALWTVARIRYTPWPSPRGLSQYVPAHRISRILFGDDQEARVVVDTVSFPPWAYCPPGAGVDAAIERITAEHSDRGEGSPESDAEPSNG